MLCESSEKKCHKFVKILLLRQINPETQECRSALQGKVRFAVTGWVFG